MFTDCRMTEGRITFESRPLVDWIQFIIIIIYILEIHYVSAFVN